MRAVSEKVLRFRFLVEVSSLRLASPTMLICGSNWPLTARTASRAADSLNCAEMTLGLLLAARVAASARLIGNTGRSGGRPRRPWGRAAQPAETAPVVP